MYAEGGVKARCRKNAEALDNAEVFDLDYLHLKRRSIGGAQVAHGLRHPVVARICKRREYHRRSVRQQADYSQKSELLNRGFFILITPF